MKEFILSSMSGETLKLPVNPSSWADEQSHNNPRFETFAMGEIKANGKRRLREMKLSSFFPLRYQSFCTYKDFPSPYECKALIEKWKDENKPIRLLITETDVNHAYTIDSFVCGERDGTGDIYYDLELSEYRFLNVPASHNPAPVASSGLKERPKELKKTVKKATNTKKQVKKQVQTKVKNAQKEDPKAKASDYDLYKIKSAELMEAAAKAKANGIKARKPKESPGQYKVSELIKKGGGSR